MVQDLYSNDAEENNGYSSHSSSECQNEDLKFNKNSPLNNKQKRSVEVLRRWFIDHLDNPYPDQEEKLKL
jgi:Homeobox KN domain